VQLVELLVVQLLGLMLPTESTNDAILYAFARFCTGANFSMVTINFRFQVECLGKLLLTMQLLWFFYLKKKKVVRKVSVHLKESTEY